MLSIIEKNRTFFVLYLLFFTTLFFYQINYYQTDALFYFSHHRSVFFNNLFLLITKLGEELAFLVIIIWFLFKKNRKMALKIVATGIAVLVISQLLKALFSHPRPITVLEQNGVLVKMNLVNDYILRGDNSFPSGHSTAAFALYTILALHYARKRNIQIFLLILAILVGISRVYLVAHFPEDILFGSAIGVFIALGIDYYFVNKIFPKQKEKAILNDLTNGQIDNDLKSKINQG
jgi:membrane-associated phospholipid phosphatase